MRSAPDQRPGFWTVLKENRAMQQDASVAILEQSDRLNAGDVPVLVETAAWRYLLRLGIETAQRHRNVVEVFTQPGLRAKLPVVEDAYHRMRLVEVPELARVDPVLFREWIKASLAGTRVQGEPLVYTKRNAVFAVAPSSLYVARLKASLPRQTAAHASSLTEFARQIADREITDAAIGEGAAVVCGPEFVAQMALVTAPIPTEAHDFARQVMAANDVVLLELSGSEFVAAVQRMRTVLASVGDGDERVELRVGKRAIFLHHDDAVERVPAVVRSQPDVWVSSSSALSAVEALLPIDADDQPWRLAQVSRESARGLALCSEQCDRIAVFAARRSAA